MSLLFLRLAVPAMITNLVGQVTIITNAVFAGRMNDPTKLATVGLSNTICNMTVLSLLMGINSA